MNKQSKIIILTIVAVIAAYLGGSYLYQKNQTNENIKKAEALKSSLAASHSPVFGNPDAPVTIVEFLDPECGTCREFYPFVKNLMAEHPGKIKLIVRYAPFHKNSVFVAKILEASRLQGKYWETIALLFERQEEWGSHHNPAPEKIWTYLPGLGLNVAKIKTDMENIEVLRNIQNDVNDVKILEISKTPTFFVNGRPLESFGYEQLQNAVLNALGI